ncbi:MAG: signal peptidase I [Bacteroidales bacterium]|jgi:signal peptidase I|nr:signal peptidase I [Bacteroidales bacterium]
MSGYDIILIITLILATAGLWKIFEKAGYAGWKAVVPFLNFYIWLKIIKKPIWWYIFILTPFINVFVILLMVVEILKCFGKESIGAQALGVIFPFLYLPYLGFSAKEVYMDPDQREKVKKGVVREWVDAIIFAVVAATIIRTFFIEAYTIPTSSMEGTLLRGDFLFVSKVSYGPRVPMTPLSFPFVHHTLPLSSTKKSYLEWITLPYYRYCGLGDVERYDAVVFNYPDGDTLSQVYQSNDSYYSLIRQFGRRDVWTNKRKYGDIITRPVDKRENYIKRCVGLPGDSLQIIDQVVYINGRALENPEYAQYSYQVVTDGSRLSQRLIDRIGIYELIQTANPSVSYAYMNESSAAELAETPIVKSVTRLTHPANKPEDVKRIFPYNPKYGWSVDNFGPVYIPRAGATVDINPDNIDLYRRVIHAYEGHDLQVKDGKVYIDGEARDSYTFEMNYYFMMGDNRHNSADSRYWGFVPEDHIVGKAVFVWLSLDPDKSWFQGKIRWDKLFRFVN